jgi:hypothetical protein
VAAIVSSAATDCRRRPTGCHVTHTITIENEPMFRYSSVAAKSIRVAISINSVEFSLGLAALPPEPEGKVTK